MGSFLVVRKLRQRLDHLNEALRHGGGQRSDANRFARTHDGPPHRTESHWSPRVPARQQRFRLSRRRRRPVPVCLARPAHQPARRAARDATHPAPRHGLWAREGRRTRCRPRHDVHGLLREHRRAVRDRAALGCRRQQQRRGVDASRPVAGRAALRRVAHVSLGRCRWGAEARRSGVEGRSSNCSGACTCSCPHCRR